MPDSPSQNTLKKLPAALIQNLAVAGGVFLLSLLAAEFIFRLFFHTALPAAPVSKVLVHEASDNLRLLYKPSPNASSPAYGVQNRINHFGFRDRNDFTIEKPAGTKRIIFLGDSVVYGYGLEAEDTIPKKLEKEFQARSKRVEVLNLGVSGYDSEQEVEFFKEIGRQFHPDLVVAGYTLNDSIYASMELDFFHDKVDRRIKVEREEWNRKILAFLFEHSELLKYFDRRWDLQRRFHSLRTYREQSIWHYIEDRNKKNKDPLDSPYQKVKSEIQSDAKKIGTAPRDLKSMLGFVGIDNDDFYSSHWNISRKAFLELSGLSAEDHFRVTAVLFPYHVGMDRYALGPMHTFLRREFESMGFAVCDLLPSVKALEGKTDLYGDPIHFNPAGAELAAKNLYEFLEKENAF